MFLSLFRVRLSPASALLLAALVLGGALAPLLHAQAQRVGPVVITVSDLARATAFYSEVLTFEKVAGSEHEVLGDALERSTGVFGAHIRSARLRLGAEEIELVEFLTPEGAPFPAGTRSNDRWFQHIAIVVSDMAAAYERLRAHHVRHASTAPQRLPDWNPNAGGIEAFYFRDPDGHHLEVIHFPVGKGDPRWQQPAGRLFLGIDHTAIVIGATEKSFAFYREALGLKVAGGADNYGTEQEHLNNVFGAHLRITALRAPGGPGVEFLEYLAPAGGRPLSADARTNDLLAWRTTVVVADPVAVATKLVQAGGRLVSLSNPGDKPARLLVRDPDGHLVELAAQP
ncbi:MAG: VOC family protein [Opitutae bacterium]|nr:VOC family protein [Opitutae bacterium]